MLTTSGLSLASSSAARRMSSEAIDRAARRVDTQDHGAHRIVIAGLVQRVDHVVRAHPVAAGRKQRIESALPLLNRAIGVDHRETVAMADVRKQRDVLVVGVLDDLMVVTAVVFDAVGEFIAVLDPIDEMGLESRLGAERRLVDELRGLARRSRWRSLAVVVTSWSNRPPASASSSSRCEGVKSFSVKMLAALLYLPIAAKLGLIPTLVEQPAREQLL